MKCKLFKLAFTYKTKKGKESYGYNYFLACENGQVVRIEPYFSKFTGEDGKEVIIDKARVQCEVLAVTAQSLEDIKYGD